MLSRLPLNSDSLLTTFPAGAAPFTTPFGLYSPLFLLVLSLLPLHSDSTHHFSCWCCPIYHSIRTLFATFPAGTVPVATPFGLYSLLFLLVLSQLPFDSDSTRHFSAGAVPVATPFGLYSPLFLLMLSQLPPHSELSSPLLPWFC